MKFEIEPDLQGKLTLRRPGEDDITDVRLRRAFPWTNPGQFVSVRTHEGKELLLIEDVAGLDVSQRELIEKYLANALFIPKITRIDEIDVRFGYQQWKVQ